MLAWRLDGPWWLQPQAVPMVSYAIATLAFLLLSMLTVRRPHAPMAFEFSLAALLTAVWAGAAVMAESPGSGPAIVLDLLEVLRTAAWLYLLARMGHPGPRRHRWLPALLLALAVMLQVVAIATPWFGASHLTMMRLALAVTGMVLVEQIYRAAPSGARWGIKLACLGIGALFAYDVYLYADALLFQRIATDIWAARGIVNALCAPLLVAAIRRNAQWDHRWQLSRQMMFRSVALLGAGFYLLAMAASAWYLRAIGGVWGPAMQLACLCGAVLLLAAVLFSGAARARLKVLIGKHMYRARYDYRAEWQRFTQGLGTDQGPLPERIIAALAGLVESPAGVLWLRHGDALYRPVAAWNMPLPLPPMALTAASGLCQMLEGRQWVVEPAAWRLEAATPGALPLPLLLPEWLADGAIWLVTPLLLDRRLFGFVCLTPPRVAIAVNWEVRDVLRIAGRQAATVLAHRQYADDLAVARQFESFNRMSAFVAHDLKNLASQLGLMLSNAERHRADPQFQDAMLATSRHALGKMQKLLRKLQPAPRDPAYANLDADSEVDTAQWVMAVDLRSVLTRALDACAGLAPQPLLELASVPVMVTAQPQRLERVVGHLLLNAVEATGVDGSVTVRLHSAGELAMIEVADTGHGMSPEFVRDRLFQPFDSTKAAGMGIGVFETRDYVRQLGGELEVVSTPGVGTCFSITLRLAH